MANDDKFFTKVYALDPNSEEFKHLFGIFEQHSPSLESVGIHRLQNKYSWMSYEREAKRLKNKLGYWSAELPLWHGTSATDPAKIIYGGFEVGYARNGACGHGLYFAQNSRYSMKYAHTDKEGMTSMILSLVLVGKPAKYPPV